jgi:hypothetical protein
MSLSLRAFLCTLVLSFLSVAQAETRRVPEHNFSIEVPLWWMNTTPPPTGTVLAIQSPRKDRSVVVIASKLPPSATATAQADTVYGMKKAFTEQEYRVSPEEKVESQGLTFTTLSATLGNVDTLIWVVANQQAAYLIRADNTAGGKLADDREVQAALHSFKLLDPAAAAKASSVTLPDQSDAVEQWAFILGSIIGILVAIVAIFLVFRSQETKRSRRHR